MKPVKKEFTQNLALIILEAQLEDDGKRLDEACSSYLLSISRSKIKTKIKTKEIELISRETKNSPHTKLRHLDQVRITHVNTIKLSFDIKNLILFEDESFIAIEKPKGMLVHPTGLHLFNVASVLLEEYLNNKIYPIHRLDKETSGVLIFCKTKHAAQSMRSLFDLHKIQKKYLFKSHNLDCEIPSTIEHNLTDDLNSKVSLKQKCTEDVASESVKAAKTLITNLKRTNGFIWGEANPLTGRLHQIRCHLAHYGAPIVGDDIYGKVSESELHLHCLSMSFIHPISKTKLHITSSNLQLDYE
ncbi:MAG: RluA family pseudouridine synthase [Thermoproteota archaeon]|jgi:RluA family pseudouridine synthase